MTGATAAPFRIIGENVHTTRIVCRPGPLVGVDEQGREAIRFVDEHVVERWLPIPSEERRTREYDEGRVKHARSAVCLAMEGDGADAEVGLAYLRAMALRQVECGALSSTSTSMSTRTAWPSRSRRCAGWSRGPAAPTLSAPFPTGSTRRIDWVTMQKGLIGSDDYLELWQWSPDVERPGSAEEVSEAVLAEIEAGWAPARTRRPAL